MTPQTGKLYRFTVPRSLQKAHGGPGMYAFYKQPIATKMLRVKTGAIAIYLGQAFFNNNSMSPKGTGWIFLFGETRCFVEEYELEMFKLALS
jgi:hypothetical protein